MNVPIFIWRGQPVKTVGDLTDALHGIVHRKNPNEAALFLERYSGVAGEYAEANVGYCLGYLSKTDLVAGLELFGVNHPIFGDARAVKRTTPDQAFMLGQGLAEIDALTRDIQKGEGK